MFSGEWAEKFQRADKNDFIVDSLLAFIEASINALTAPTSRKISLLCASALHDKLRKTLAVTYTKKKNSSDHIIQKAFK